MTETAVVKLPTAEQLNQLEESGFIEKAKVNNCNVFIIIEWLPFDI